MSAAPWKGVIRAFVERVRELGGVPRVRRMGMGSVFLGAEVTRGGRTYGVDGAVLRSLRPVIARRVVEGMAGRHMAEIEEEIRWQEGARP